MAAVCGLPLALCLAAPARADEISDFVDAHGNEVCNTMRAEQNFIGVKHAIDVILATSGLPQDQTGRLLAASVKADCPEAGALVEEFVWVVKHHNQQDMQQSDGAILGF